MKKRLLLILIILLIFSFNTYSNEKNIINSNVNNSNFFNFINMNNNNLLINNMKNKNAEDICKISNLDSSGAVRVKGKVSAGSIFSGLILLSLIGAIVLTAEYFDYYDNQYILVDDGDVVYYYYYPSSPVLIGMMAGIIALWVLTALILIPVIVIWALVAVLISDNTKTRGIFVDNSTKETKMGFKIAF